MGLSFWNFLKPKSGKTKYIEVSVDELCGQAIEYSARELSFMSCVNMIANAISRCEVRTYQNNKEIKQREYYTFNVNPNTNQNSTVFWHKLITRLFCDGEALVISTRKKDGYDALCVADSYMLPEIYPDKQCEYKQVTVGSFTYDKTFRENEVLHFTLNHVNIRPLLNGMYSSYCKLLDSAIKQSLWSKGQHWKVHVDSVASGQADFEARFAQMIKEQIKPYFDTDGAVLPEFDGYTYERQSGDSKSGDTRDIRSIIDDIYTMTARGLGIPPALLMGDVAGIGDVNTQFLSLCIDPLCDQIAEEINRKRYTYDDWRQGNFVIMDSSAIMHFDMFNNAASIEKLIGTGAFTINDVRRAAGQPEIAEDWANTSYMTKNIGNIANGELASLSE